MTASRSRTSSRAARSPSGSAARGCLPPLSARTTRRGCAAARKNVGARADAGGEPAGRYTFVGGSNLMMFKASKHKDAAWALIKYLSGRPGPDRLRGADGHVPGAPRSRRRPSAQSSGANHSAFYAAIKQGRTYAPIPQWAQVENAYKGRFGHILDEAARARASERRDPVPARRGGQGGRRPARPERGLAATLLRRAGRAAAPPVRFLSHEHNHPHTSRADVKVTAEPERRRAQLAAALRGAGSIIGLARARRGASWCSCT